MAVKKPCKTCYDTGVYYQPIGPEGELLQPMVCPCQSTTEREEGGDTDAR